MATRSTGRRRTLTQERDRLAVLLEQRLPEIAAPADAQRDLAAVRGQVVDLGREVDRLRTELAESRCERRRLERLLQRMQAVARNYADDLAAAERHLRASGWWPRFSAVLAGRRGPPEPIHESRPGATV